MTAGITTPAMVTMIMAQTKICVMIVKTLFFFFFKKLHLKSFILKSSYLNLQEKATITNLEHMFGLLALVF